MNEPDGISAHLTRNEHMCARMGSPFSAELLHRTVQDYEQGGVIRAFFEADRRRGQTTRIGLRLLGAWHALALDGSDAALAAHYPSTGGDGDASAAWRAAERAMATHAQRIATIFEQTPQTNEVARAMPLLGGLLALAARSTGDVRLFDVGSSAGLMLRLDAYGYEGRGWQWGDRASELVLRNRETSGSLPHRDVPMRIVERRGCDLHPLDPNDPAQRVTLLSYIWADQRERFERAQAAYRVARRVPAPVDTADLFQWVPAIGPRDGALTVFMHSVVAEHFSAEMRERLRMAMTAACSRATKLAPMAWLRMEQGEHHFETRATLWPSGDDLLVATSDGHAQEIEWQLN